MNRKILTDSDGDELSLNYYDQPGQDPTTGVYVGVCADGELIAAGPFTPEALHAALDAVAPAGSDTRTGEERRTLTADDIESVLHSILPLSTEHLGPDDIADIASDLYTALTVPPRPEGAEELEADMEEWYRENGTPVGGTGDRLADHLAALGYRKTGVES